MLFTIIVLFTLLCKIFIFWIILSLILTDRKGDVDMLKRTNHYFSSFTVKMGMRSLCCWSVGIMNEAEVSLVLSRLIITTTFVQWNHSQIVRRKLATRPWRQRLNWFNVISAVLDEVRRPSSSPAVACLAAVTREIWFRVHSRTKPMFSDQLLTVLNINFGFSNVKWCSVICHTLFCRLPWRAKK